MQWITEYQNTLGDAWENDLFDKKKLIEMKKVQTHETSQETKIFL